MASAADSKADTLPDLDDLLQCPVCYEIPSGQIFQCNEGHHVCGRCKARLDLCPVCRSLFFGTRNYAMEELIANVKKLQAFKLGGKMTVTSGSGGSESTASADTSVAGAILNGSIEEESNDDIPRVASLRAPAACKGLFRCLCCKNDSAARLPAARLLNHLRYFHSPNLIEGKSENGEYVQAWQIATVPGRIVIAVRVTDMGIFFLIIEMSKDSIYSWVSMASAPWVAHDFSYTITIAGNDREAIFSDCVWSVRSCEGALKKRGRSLVVDGLDVRALTATTMVSGRLSLKRAPPDQVAHQAQPRAVLRVANRGASEDSRSNDSFGLQSALQEMQNDVARLSRVFSERMLEIGREASLRSEPGTRSRQDNEERPHSVSNNRPSIDASAQAPPQDERVNYANPPMSRNSRRRLRRRLRAAMNGLAEVTNGSVEANIQRPRNAPQQRVVQQPTVNIPTVLVPSVFSVVSQPPVPPPNFGGPSHRQQNGNQPGRSNRRRRPHRR